MRYRGAQRKETSLQVGQVVREEWGAGAGAGKMNECVKGSDKGGAEGLCRAEEEGIEPQKGLKEPGLCRFYLEQKSQRGSAPQPVPTVPPGIQILGLSFRMGKMAGVRATTEVTKGDLLFTF